MRTNNLCKMAYMNKRPEIIKPKQVRERETISRTSSESLNQSKSSLLEEEAVSPTASSVDEVIESFVIPKQLEYGEAIEPPPPINPNSLSAWQPELREIAWEHQFDVWEELLYD